MLTIDAAALAACTPYDRLLEALEAAFATGWTAPPRHRHLLPTTDGSSATMLLMPGWRAGEFAGIKIVNVFPGNALKALPAVTSLYLLFDGATGVPLAMLDGETLTARRTAAASALAASRLARPDAQHLLVVGAGRMAIELPSAHAAVRPISQVTIWNRSSGRAAQAADTLKARGFNVDLATDLRDAVRAADIVSCATLSTAPLILGSWLKPGVHLDLVGAFRPDMREVDGEAVRLSTVVVDTRDSALSEAGDLVAAISEGVVGPDHIAGDLHDLCLGRTKRRSADEITLFKSVGVAVEDLAAAVLAYQQSSRAHDDVPR